MTFNSAIYEGDVIHDRRRPKRHRLRYGVFSLLLDIDELAALDKELPLFGYNRWAPMAFHDHDHGSTRNEPLRPWVEEQLRTAGVMPDGGAIRLLCYPRIFGYVFNPLSVFFCYRKDGGLAAILYEVCNTFKERHTYVIPVSDSDRPVIRQQCDKSLYVSPFVDMAVAYHFRIVPPGDGINVVIRQEDGDGLLLAASFRGRRSDMTGRTVFKTLARFPLMTVKIIAAIHWEALRLFLKGLRVFAHRPASRRIDASFIQPTSTGS